MSQFSENTTVYENYLHDLCILIKEMAIEASQEAKKTKTDFAVGYSCGLSRVVSLMQQQADAFNIPLEKLRLDRIDPDAYLG
jgi:hypothetical protein